MALHSQPTGNSLFNRAFSLGGSAHQFVDPRSIQIRASWPVRRRRSRFARPCVDPVGGNAAHLSIHAQSMVDPDNHARGDRKAALRILARLARLGRGQVRNFLAGGVWGGGFPGGGSDRPRLLFDLFRRSLATPPTTPNTPLGMIGLTNTRMNQIETAYFKTA